MHWYRRQTYKPKRFTSTLSIRYLNGAGQEFSISGLEESALDNCWKKFNSWFRDKATPSYSMKLEVGYTVVVRSNILDYTVRIKE